jgi:hypothetical protein
LDQCCYLNLKSDRLWEHLRGPEDLDPDLHQDPDPLPVWQQLGGKSQHHQMHSKGTETLPPPVPHYSTQGQEEPRGDSRYAEGSHSRRRRHVQILRLPRQQGKRVPTVTTSFILNLVPGRYRNYRTGCGEDRRRVPLRTGVQSGEQFQDHCGVRTQRGSPPLRTHQQHQRQNHRQEYSGPGLGRPVPRY